MEVGKGGCPSIEMTSEILDLQPFCQYLLGVRAWGTNRLPRSAVPLEPCPQVTLPSAKSRRREQAEDSSQNSLVKKRPRYVTSPAEMPVVSAMAPSPLRAPWLSSAALPEVRAGHHVHHKPGELCSLQPQVWQSSQAPCSPVCPLLWIWLYSLLSSYFWTVIDHWHLLRVSWTTSTLRRNI